VFYFLLSGCRNEISPCACAENLKKVNLGFDEEFDESCDDYLENLNESDAKKWTDSMMNCKNYQK
jgi:hypothetical protein